MEAANAQAMPAQTEELRLAQPVTAAEDLQQPREATSQQAVTSALAKKRGHGAALLGAGLTLAVTLVSQLAVTLLLKRRDQQKTRKTQPSTASTPRHAASSEAGFGFGSPTPLPDVGSPRIAPKQRPAAVPAATATPAVQHVVAPTPVPVGPAEPEIDTAQLDAKAVLPAGQLKQQLQLLQEVQQENARLQAFMREFMSNSDKVKNLEQENAELKAVTSKLQTQLNDIKSRAIISNGDELTSFKDAVRDRFPAIARSVCSDIDFDKMKDTASVDGSASVADMNTRKKMGALSQLFAWANQAAVPKSQAASQASTPRRTRSTQDGVQSSDVLQLLNAFSSGGMQF